jgi:hypothetical protein
MNPILIDIGYSSSEQSGVGAPAIDALSSVSVRSMVTGHRQAPCRSSILS